VGISENFALCVQELG